MEEKSEHDQQRRAGIFAASLSFLRITDRKQAIETLESVSGVKW